MTMRASRGAAVALVALATFSDILAYSIAVPVLPDQGRQLGASPTVIGRRATRRRPPSSVSATIR